MRVGIARLPANKLWIQLPVSSLVSVLQKISRYRSGRIEGCVAPMTAQWSTSSWAPEIE
jgi:hypothetical protein